MNSDPKTHVVLQDDQPPEMMAYRRLLGLAIAFLLGLLLVAGLSLLFSNLIDDLDQQNTNERARLFIGEEIVRGIQEIEKNFYQMAATRGSRARSLIEADILERIEKLGSDLKALQVGGKVQQILLLNIDGVDQMVRESEYRPTADDSQYILEIIELAPHLDQAKSHVATLRGMLDTYEAQLTTASIEDEHRQEREINMFLKGMWPFFHRLNENANRLYYDSNREITRISEELAQKRSQYKSLEIVLIITVIIVVTLFSILVVRQAKASNQHMLLAWEAMRDARDKAQLASQAKSDFVSRMSHELRTPLNAILGFAQLLEDESITPTQRQHVAIINQAGTHLLDLINQILDMAKIEAGKLELEQLNFDPLRLADDVAAIMGKNAQAKGLIFKSISNCDLPPLIQGDPTRLRQVLINLLGNALKFTHEGEVGLRATWLADTQRIRFEIWDSGIGMTRETLDRLFRPFTQADESSSRKYGGTGLGLSISKDLVEAMGGEIHAESAPGEGSRFWLEIPIHLPPDAPARPKPLAGKHSAVISSDEFTRHRTGELLTGLGATVKSFADIDSAREALAGPDSVLPDWVVADQQTPNIFSLCSLVADQSGIHRLLIDSPQSDAEPGSFTPHADALLKPPVTYTQLAEIIVTVLNRAPQTNTSVSPSHSHQTQQQQELSGHVLLVEDNRINQKLASLMLTKMGLSHDLASDGTEALEKHAQHHYDLILMDMEMPEMDGVTATRAIRAREAQTSAFRVPIIAMTANALQEDRDRCMEAGMDDHLAKPVEFEKVRRLLQLWLSRSPTETHST